MNKDLYWNSKHSYKFISICTLPTQCVCVLYIILWPIPVAALSKAWVGGGGSIAGIASLNTAGGMDACFL